MKVIILFVVVSLLAGCQKPEAAGKMAALEERISLLEKRIDGLPGVFDGLREGIETNTAVVQKAMANLKTMQEENKDLEGLLEELVKVQTNTPAKVPARVAYVPTTAVSGAATPNSVRGSVGAVPDQVLREIKAEARRRWPESYTMQEWVIGREIEAYRKVHQK